MATHIVLAEAALEQTLLELFGILHLVIKLASPEDLLVNWLARDRAFLVLWR